VTGTGQRGATLLVAWYRFRATLRRRWAGYVGLAVLTGLVGGVALAAVTAARRTDSSYPGFLASTNPSDLIVQPGTSPGYAPQFLAQLARLPHVRHVGNSVVLEAARLRPDGTPTEYFLGNGNVQFVADVNGLFYTQDRVTIIRGRMADPARADEIVVSRAAAAQLGLHVGSHLRTGLYTSTQNVAARPRVKLDLTVTGIAVFNTEVLQDDINAHFAFILGTPALARAYAGCCTSYMYDGLKLAGGSRYDAAVESEYAQLLATSPLTRAAPELFVYVTAAIEVEAQRGIRPEAIALGVFGLIAGLATLIIGAQSISRQLRAESDDAGVLRALGAGPATTVADGLAGLLVAVVAGALLAGAVAIGLSPLTLFGPVRAVTPVSGLYLDWTVLGLGALALALALAAVAAVIGYRLAPHRVAVRRAPARPGTGPVRAAVAAGLPAAGVAGVRFALEPGRGRTAVPVRSVIAGAVLAALVGTATLTFGASLSTLISHPALYGWDFSYAMFAEDGYGPLPTSYVKPMLAADKSIAGTTGVYFLAVQIDGQMVNTMGVPPHAAVAPLLSGHGLDGPGQIVLGPATLAQLGKHVGVPLGIAAGRLLWLAFARELSAVPDPVVPAGSVALAAVAALVLVNLIGALPGRSAARTPAALVLRAE
jgi:hypothetical protein